MATGTRENARERLLDAAEELVNADGFAATSVERIIERVGVTKGTFFYHFNTKHDLARALIDRYAAMDQAVLRSNLERAERLSDDPLQQVLIFVGLLLEVAEQLDANPVPCCLFVTYCFESGLFDDEIRGVISGAMEEWERAVSEKLHAAAARTPPRAEVDLDATADMLTALFEGAFVVARARPGRSSFTAQLRQYRTYLQLLFGTVD